MEQLISLFILLFYLLPVANSVRCTAIKANGIDTITYQYCYTCVEAQCFNCEAGYANLATCTRCAAGTYSPGGTALCQNCAAGTYSYAASGSCSNCPGGTFSGSTASGCTSCLPGQYSTSISAALGCASCPAGSYSSSPGSSASDCLLCSAGSYSPTGSPSCIQCGAGQYSSAGAGGCSTCPAGQFSNAGSGSCSTCLKGTYSQAGAGSCTTCSAGTYSGDGAGKCSQCAAGSWSSGGSDSCAVCLAGTYSPFPGATSSAACLSCSAGQYSNAGAVLCESCDAGLYSNAGDSVCTKCPAGTFSPFSGSPSSACRLCSEGYYSKEGSVTCEICPPGTYSSPGAAMCLSCPYGETSYAGSPSCFKNADSQIPDVTRVSMNAVSKIGSSVCIGSSMFVSAGLIMKIFQNMRFMEIAVSQELRYAFQTWDNNVLAIDAPEKWKAYSGTLPAVFAQYEMKSNFLVNYWSYLLTIVIGLASVVILKLVKYDFAEMLKGKRIASAVMEFFITATCNFTMVQVFNSLDSIVFYSILDLRFSGFTYNFTTISSVVGIGFLVLAAGMILLNLLIVYKYLKMKRIGPQILDNFLKKLEVFEVIYKDLKDDSGFKLSFFAVMIIRAVISSIIMAIFYNSPLLQAILLMAINVFMLAFLILVSPFKELYDELAQYFYELIVFIGYFCVLLMAIADKNGKEAFGMRQNTGKCIIALDMILLAGTVAFLCIEIYKKIVEIYEAWKEETQGETIRSETTRGFLAQTQEELTKREMTDVSFNQNNLLENSASFKRSLSIKKSQIFPLSQASHLDLGPKDEVDFGEEKGNRESSPQDPNVTSRSRDPNSSRRYVRRKPSRIHHDLSEDVDSSPYYFKPNYNDNETEMQIKKEEKSSSNIFSFVDPSVNNGPQNPQRNAMESIHEDQRNEERVEDQEMISKDRMISQILGKKRRIKQRSMADVENENLES